MKAIEGRISLEIKIGKFFSIKIRKIFRFSKTLSEKINNFLARLFLVKRSLYSKIIAANYSSQNHSQPLWFEISFPIDLIVFTFDIRLSHLLHHAFNISASGFLQCPSESHISD